MATTGQSYGFSRVDVQYAVPAIEELNRDLYRACEEGDAEEVERLVIAGADIYHEGGPQGESPLHAASANGHANIVEYLLYNGSKVNAKDRYQQTPLHKASRNGHSDVIQVIVKYNPAINSRDKLNGHSPLHEAVEARHFNCVQVLVQNGAKIDAKCSWKQKTALQMASETGEFEMMQFLFKSKNSGITV